MRGAACCRRQLTPLWLLATPFLPVLLAPCVSCSCPAVQQLPVACHAALQATACMSQTPGCWQSSTSPQQLHELALCSCTKVTDRAFVAICERMQHLTVLHLTGNDKSQGEAGGRQKSHPAMLSAAGIHGVISPPPQGADRHARTQASVPAQQASVPVQRASVPVQRASAPQVGGLLPWVDGGAPNKALFPRCRQAHQEGAAAADQRQGAPAAAAVHHGSATWVGGGRSTDEGRPAA